MTEGSEPMERINKKISRMQYLAALTGLLNMVTNGMHYGWTSPSLPKFNESAPFTITSEEGSWIVIMPLLGAVVGSVIVANIIDIIGSKRINLISSIPFFLAWIMIAYSKSVIMIYIARFIAGIADGLIFTAIPMYLSEIAHPKIRGFLGTGILITYFLGVLMINVIGSYMSIFDAALISSVVPLIGMTTFFFMPESPYNLLKRGMPHEAMISIQRLRGTTDVGDEFNRINAAVNSNGKAKTAKFWELFTNKVNRKAVYILIIVRGVQQLSGSASIMFYTQTIFIETGGIISPENSSILYFSIQLICLGLSSYIVDRLGRKPLLMISIAGAGIFLLVEGAYFYIKSCSDINTDSFSIVPVIGLLGFCIIYSLGLSSVPVVLLGEIFSPSIKRFALSFADIYMDVIITVISKFFQLMNDYFGMYSSFLTFSACCFAGLFLVLFFVPETKGKTLEEIQVSLDAE